MKVSTLNDLAEALDSARVNAVKLFDEAFASQDVIAEQYHGEIEQIGQLQEKIADEIYIIDMRLK